MSVTRPAASLGAVTALVICVASCDDPADSAEHATPQFALDLSGIAWIDSDRFLVVHDSKNPDELERPRVSTVSIPTSAAGLAWKLLDVHWPTPLGLSSDLESVAHIPGTDSFLLVESGEGIVQGRQFRRVFLVRLDSTQLRLESFFELPNTVRNIEGAAVARMGDQLIFLFGERAHGEASSVISWAPLALDPLTLGAVRHVNFTPDTVGRRGWRPVTAIEIDGAGHILIASAFDPDEDTGPFSSVIWLAGHVEAGSAGGTIVVIDSPVRLATIDGFKVEALAVRRAPSGEQWFAATDDENYGGTIRHLPELRLD